MNNNETHASFAIHDVGDDVLKNDKAMDLSDTNVRNAILKKYDTIKATKAESGSNERVMLQYINQLSNKGIAAVVNATSLYIRMKRQI